MTDLHSVLEYLQSNEVRYILLIFIIFIVPRLLQRYRIPAAISSFGLGLVAGLGFDQFRGDATIALLATLGIVTLFLHAGLDINLQELHRNRRILLQHILFFVVLLAAATVVTLAVTEFPFRVCVLIALALATPSTGFILDSIKSLGLSGEEQGWVGTKAVATELVAILCMVFMLQSLRLEPLLVSLFTMLALILFVPLLFRLFAARIAPFAPNSEFAFLIMLATACAFVTRKLGAYYLVGAFIVGVAARRFQEQIPSVGSERLIGAVEMFASFFVPFYFFYSGSLLVREDFSAEAWLVGLVMVVVLIPVRAIMVASHRKFALNETFRQGLRVAVPMLPTLIFTLVLAQIMREQFKVGGAFYGGLIIYAITNSLLVGVLFKAREVDFSADMLEDGMARIGYTRDETSR